MKPLEKRVPREFKPAASVGLRNVDAAADSYQGSLVLYADDVTLSSDMDQGDNPSQGSRRTADPAARSPLSSGSSNEAERCGAEERAKQESESERPAESLLPSLEGGTFDDSAADAERLEKINKLKKAIAGGTYNVSAGELARKLIEHMRDPKPEPKG